MKLASYQAANDPAAMTASIIQALASGVSTREMQKVKPGAPGVSKSNISRLWQQAGSKFVDELRESMRLEVGKQFLSCEIL